MRKLSYWSPSITAIQKYKPEITDRLSITMRGYLVVGFFVLLMINCQLRSASAATLIPNKLRDVTAVVHRAEKDGHRIIIQIDANIAENYAAIAVTQADACYFTKVSLEEAAKPLPQSVTFMAKSKRDFVTEKEYYFLTEDFFKIERVPVEDFQGCSKHFPASSTDEDLIMFESEHGIKSYLMGARTSYDEKEKKTWEKVIGTFIPADKTSLWTPGKNAPGGWFYGVKGDGSPFNKEIPAAMNWAYAEVFCKVRHDADKAWGDVKKT